MKLNVLLNPTRYKKVLVRQKEEIFRRLAPVVKGVTDDLGEGVYIEEGVALPQLLLARLSLEDQRQLIDVERALSKFEDSRYGRCESCSEVISVSRLLAKPAARFCLNCRRQREREKAFHLVEGESIEICHTALYSVHRAHR